MGRKKKADSLGRALIKNRFSHRDRRNDSLLHTSELDDGYEWGRLNLQSVTEESSFEEFLRTAELAGTEFQAEKLNVSFVNVQQVQGLLTAEEKAKFETTKKEKSEFIRIPRRPDWDENTSGEELQAAEREAFLEWRRKLALFQEEEGLILTPYEKNLDFWRQLWRVVERSDIVVQIVDARNPLLFHCEDLDAYVKEVNPYKKNFLLLNKSDLLTNEQRVAWAKYFDSIKVRCAFFSAISQDKVLDLIEEDENEDTSSSEESPNSEEDKEGPKITKMKEPVSLNKVNSDSTVCKSNSATEAKLTDLRNGEEDWESNDSEVLSREELMRLFERLVSCGPSGRATVGFVGYPNVGKSSTINTLVQTKKVSVSATPGKTKHFQTLVVEDSFVTLCDCPGLVMPSLVATKADMLLAGILSIDQMRDFAAPTATLRSLVPDHVFEQTYGIMVPPQPHGAPPHSPYTLLNAYAYSRGFMTQNGQPDGSRASRLILKDLVGGKLVVCLAPPGTDQSSFHRWPEPARKPAQLTPAAIRAISDKKTVSVNELDKTFFNKMSVGAHTKGSTLVKSGNQDEDGASQTAGSKPWKDHSHKRNKKEKLRRIYRHLDE